MTHESEQDGDCSHLNVTEGLFSIAKGLELLTRSRFHQIRGSSLLTVRNGNSILS